MIFEYIVIGAAAKAIASFDDVVARIPVIAQVTKTMRGRFAFAIGNILAMTAGLIVAWLLSSLLQAFAYTHIIVGILVLGLAGAVYFDVFGKKEESKIKVVEKKVQHYSKNARFFQLIGIGFVVSIITLLDDTIVLVSLLSGPAKEQIGIVIGIYLSTFIQLGLMVYAAEKISHLKYLKEFASAGLVVLAVLVLLQIV